MATRYELSRTVGVVMDSETADHLGGACSDELARQSEAASPEGHAMARLVDGQWEHVPAGCVAAVRARGVEVRRVYVVRETVAI